MGVRYQHPEYVSISQQWAACRDAAAGQKKIHDGGETYLPKLSDQSPDGYLAYKKRALFYNATWRTVEVLRGLVFRKSPVIEVPGTIIPLLDDITMGGTSLEQFAKDVVEECLITGRVGVLVDYPTTGGGVLTQADEQRLSLRPAMAIYPAESIINWAVGRRGTARVLNLVVLIECEYVHLEVSDEFSRKEVKTYRVLDLFDGVYRVRRYEVGEKGQDVLLSETFPTMAGENLTFIPFYFLGVDSTLPETDTPPLMDLVYVNLAHYRVTADYEHGCHFVGLPQPWIAGYTPGENEKLSIGGDTAWVFPDPNAKAGFLEFDGQGLGALEKNLQEKELKMAALGARLIQQDKKGVESAETASINRIGETSSLTAAAITISHGLTKALKTFVEWARMDASGVFIRLNTDFLPMPLDYQALTALVASWQKGAISYDTLFANLKQGEVVRGDRTAEEEQALVANAPPTLTGG